MILNAAILFQELPLTVVKFPPIYNISLITIVVYTYGLIPVKPELNGLNHVFVFKLNAANPFQEFPPADENRPPTYNIFL